MTDHRLFKRIFILALVPQLALCVCYWIFGVDYSGGESEFQRLLSIVYIPGLYLVSPALLLGWPGVGLLQLAFPLAGAILYSLVIAAIVYAAKRSYFSAFFSLFRSGT
ncbi:hypothetical protein [Lysobacter fragariae]